MDEQQPGPGGPRRVLTTTEQLVVKALDEHFTGGAKAKQLLEFLSVTWKKNIDVANLDSALRSLHKRKVIGRPRPGVWDLTNRKLFFVPDEK